MIVPPEHKINTNSFVLDTNDDDNNEEKAALPFTALFTGSPVAHVLSVKCPLAGVI